MIRNGHVSWRPSHNGQPLEQTREWNLQFQVAFSAKTFGLLFSKSENPDTANGYYDTEIYEVLEKAANGEVTQASIFNNNLAEDKLHLYLRPGLRLTHINNRWMEGLDFAEVCEVIKSTKSRPIKLRFVDVEQGWVEPEERKQIAHVQRRRGTMHIPNEPAYPSRQEKKADEERHVTFAPSVDNNETYDHHSPYKDGENNPHQFSTYSQEELPNSKQQLYHNFPTAGRRPDHIPRASPSSPRARRHLRHRHASWDEGILRHQRRLSLETDSETESVSRGFDSGLESEDDCKNRLVSRKLGQQFLAQAEQPEYTGMDASTADRQQQGKNSGDREKRGSSEATTNLAPYLAGLGVGIGLSLGIGLLALIYLKTNIHDRK